MFYAGDGVYRALSEDGPRGLGGARGERRCGATARGWSSRPSARGAERLPGPARRRGGRRAAPRARCRSSPTRTSGRSRCCKDAALLQLDLLLARARRGPDAEGRHALQRAVRRARGRCSSTSARSSACAPGEPWAGYRQFCMLFLYPLMLQAYKDVPFHAAGCAARSTASRPRRRARCCRSATASARACSSNVLPARAARGALRATRGRRGQARDEAAPASSKELIGANVAQAAEARRPARVEARRDGLGRLRRATTPTTTTDAARKDEFVREAAARRGAGGSPGTSAATTAATRGSPPRRPTTWSPSTPTTRPSSALPRAARRGRPDILPLVDEPHRPVAGPRLARARAQRRCERPRHARPGARLALVHHVCITGNVPVREFLDWLRALGGALVIEFPDREDPMVQRLLAASARAATPTTSATSFERALGDAFDVERTRARCAPAPASSTSPRPKRA